MERKLKAKLIVNPACYNADEKYSKVEGYLENKIDFDVDFTEYKGHAEEIARESLDYDLIVPVGGDGTTNEVLNGSIGSGIPIGPIPIGNANAFAKSIGIKSLEEACERLYKGKIEEVDILKVNNRYATFCTDLGFFGDVIRNLDEVPDSIKRLPWVFQYAHSVIFTDKETREMTIKYDGKEVKGKKLTTAILNTPCIGGGIKFAPEAKLDDGLLDLLIIGDLSPAEFYLSSLIIYPGWHIKYPKIQYEKVKEIYVYAETPAYVQVDGDLLTENPVQDIHVEVVPKALKIKV